MIIQTLVKSAFACNLLALPVCTPDSAIEVSAQDLGLEIGEEELARELGAEYRTGTLDQPAPEFDPEEFDTVYTSFIA